ncbi:unnamed protein product [Malus baccata var. baccata]
MVLLLTIPGLNGLRKGLITVTRNLLKLFLSVKYETHPSCEGDSCTPSEHLRHQSLTKMKKKTQKNWMLSYQAS